MKIVLGTSFFLTLSAHDLNMLHMADRVVKTRLKGGSSES